MTFWPLLVLLASEPGAPAPGAPVDVQARATPQGVVVTWKPAPGDAGTPSAAAAFEVYRRDSAKGAAVRISAEPLPAGVGGEGAPRAFAFGDRGAPPETTVWYTVAGLDAAGRRGPQSAPAEVFVPDFTANAAPGRIDVAPGRGWISVWWETTGNPNTLGYRVERAMEENGVFVPLNAIPAGGPPFADANGLPGVAYWYRVVSLNRASQPGPPSAVVMGVFPVRRPPMVPANLAAERLPGVVRLRWAPGDTPSLQGFRVERESGKDGWILLTPFPTIEARFDDRLPAGLDGPVRYRVLAVGLDGKVSPPAVLLVAP